MIHSKQDRIRRGVVLPLVTICLVGLMSFLALAIDIGVLAVARNQAQDAADGAALAGARTLNGLSSANYNVTAATQMARTVAESNAILGTNITAAQVTTDQAGIYQYSTSAGRFQAVFGQTPTGTQSYGVIQVVITTSQKTTFANVMGISSMNVTANATAVHRPRDIAVVLDFSGSMGYSTQINYNAGSVQSLNPDASFPQFGPYSVFAGAGMVLDPSNPGTAPGNYATYTPTTPMQRIWPYVDGSGYEYSPCNLTMTTANGPAVVNNFLLSDQVTNAFVNSGSFPSFTNINVSGTTNPTNVVTPRPATFVSDNAANFVGDPFPLRPGVTVATGTAPTPNQYAQCVADVLGLNPPPGLKQLLDRVSRPGRRTVTTPPILTPTPPGRYAAPNGCGHATAKPASQQIPRFHDGAGILGQDLLYVAARPANAQCLHRCNGRYRLCRRRLAAALLPAAHRLDAKHARQLGVLEQRGCVENTIPWRQHSHRSIPN